MMGFRSHVVEQYSDITLPSHTMVDQRQSLHGVCLEFKLSTALLITLNHYLHDMQPKT